MYKKETRTKNLTLRDIHVGDWVQVWSPTVERYSPPMKITSIHDDGTIYLIPGEGCECDPWEENIKNVDALPITEDLLRGFGSRVMPIKKGIFYEHKPVYYKEELIGIISYPQHDDPSLELIVEGIKSKYIHEYIQVAYNFGLDINLEWKGVNKQQESHETE